MGQYFHLNDETIAARRNAASAAGHVLYQYAGDIPLAIRVAQATGRPLLLLGDPGCGKSTLARDVAHSLGHAYIEEVITSRTVARDLLWRFDHVRRLGDAAIQSEAPKVKNLRHYLEPGPLWWAIDPGSATLRGASPGEAAATQPPVTPATNPARVNPGSASGTVLLLDEIDKADPDVPNDLLVALGEFRFEIGEPLTKVAQAEGRELLVFLTSNGERDLPPAFQRRCVPLQMKRPGRPLLTTIIDSHCRAEAAQAGMADQLPGLIDAVLTLLASPPASAAGLRKPGTAEAIDAVRACIAEGVSVPAGDEPPDPRWDAITRLTLWKQVEPAHTRTEPR